MLSGEALRSGGKASNYHQHMCPRTTIYVSSYYYICVLVLLCMCLHATRQTNAAREALRLFYKLYY
jgi:hypothetical protein